MGISKSSLTFVRRKGLYSQCVYIRLHQLAHGVKDRSMTLDSRLPIECIGDDQDVEVAFAILRPGMTFMQVTLILDAYLSRGKCVNQLLFN